MLQSAPCPRTRASPVPDFLDSEKSKIASAFGGAFLKRSTAGFGFLPGVNVALCCPSQRKTSLAAGFGAALAAAGFGAASGAVGCGALAGTATFAAVFGGADAGG